MNNLLNQLIELDTHLFLYLNSLGNENWDDFWLWFTTQENWYPLYIFLILYTAFLYRKNWRLGVSLILLSVTTVIIVDFITSDVFKPSIGRLRPCYDAQLQYIVRLVKHSCGGKYSFFSGHSSNSFAIALFFGRWFRDFKRNWVSILLLIWASMMAYSRVYIGVHYPLDIIAGGIWGGLFGYFAYQYYCSLTNPTHLKPNQGSTSS